MSDRPIIFSAPMIIALLAGTKTMTRRLLYSKRKARNGIIPASATFMTDHPPPRGSLGASGFPEDIAIDEYWALTGWQAVKPGDRLWVKETWRGIQLGQNTFLCAYRANCEGDRFTYAEDGSVESIQIRKWRSPLHMTRIASRLTLEVPAVRIERLHEITEEDAKAEGFGPHENCGTWTPHKASFAEFWCKVHRQSDWWAADPFVVAITFKTHVCNIDALPAESRAA